MKRVSIPLGILIILFSACIDTEPVSPVPEIGFKSLEVFYAYDSLLEQYILAGELVFDFIDGDADLGIYPDQIDTIEWNESNYNVFLTPYEKINSNYAKIDPDSSNPPPWYSILHNTKLDRVGQNKTVKGTINLFIIDIPEYDTIRYDFYIRDRAGNESNIESTSDVGTRVDPPSN